MITSCIHSHSSDKINEQFLFLCGKFDIEEEKFIPSKSKIKQ
jgi:hypothetical protein